MSKLIPLDEAARLLGLSVDRLTEMRSNNEIFAYRDGNTWKFKMSELERVADELGMSLSANALDEQNDDADGSSFFLSESGRDLLNEEQSQISGISGISDLDLSNELESSAKKEKFLEGESDEMLEDSSADLFGNDGDESEFDFDLGDAKIESGGDSIEINLEDSGILSKDELAASSSSKKSKDSIKDSVFDDDELSFGSSSIKVASESSRKLAAAGTDSDVLNEKSDSDKSSSDTGKMLGNDDDLSFSMSDEDLFEDDISLTDGSVDESVELSSDFGESEELILDDSDSSSEVRLDAGGSGINLAANESGIELMDDSSLDLVGSDIDALELPEDDDELIELESNDENEFNLTPLADPLEEDESTGSQVIALEDSEIYADDSAEAMLEEDGFSAQSAGLEDSFDQGFDGGFGEGAGFSDQMGVPTGPAALPEAPYTVWNVLALSTAAVFMLMGAMVAYEACQNMWMADEALSRRGVLSFFLKLTGS